jgi:hypothetical protein
MIGEQVKRQFIIDKDNLCPCTAKPLCKMYPNPFSPDVNGRDYFLRVFPAAPF